MTEVITFFLLLLAGHLVGDFVFQPSPMSAGKNRHNKMQEKYGENYPQWYYWLSAHGSMHGIIVYIISGSIVLLLLEFFSHWIIDFCKCESWINLHQDQTLHLLAKIVYCLIFFYMPGLLLI